MELFIFIAAVRWLSDMARTAGRSPLLWGTAGAFAYIGGFFVSALMVGPVLSAAKSGLALVVYVAAINAAGLGLVNILCRERFNKNLTTTTSLARILNIGAIVSWSVFWMPQLMGSFVMGDLKIEEVNSALPIAALYVVLVATLFVLRKDAPSVTGAVWPRFVVVSANVILAGALLWYSTTWDLSQPGTMYVIAAYMFSWSALTAGLNVLCIGLTIRSSRSL